MEKSELDDGKIYRNHPIWGKNPWVSSRFSLPPIHWLVMLLWLLVLIVSQEKAASKTAENTWSHGRLFTFLCIVCDAANTGSSVGSDFVRLAKHTHHDSFPTFLQLRPWVAKLKPWSRTEQRNGITCSIDLEVVWFKGDDFILGTAWNPCPLSTDGSRGFGEHQKSFGRCDRHQGATFVKVVDANGCNFLGTTRMYPVVLQGENQTNLGKNTCFITGFIFHCRWKPVVFHAATEFFQRRWYRRRMPKARLQCASRTGNTTCQWFEVLLVDDIYIIGYP